MTASGYLLIDGMNIAHASNSGAVLTSGTQQTQAIYGSIRTIRKTVSTFKGLKPVVMWDGPMNWRKGFFPEYKANRDKPPVTKHEIDSAKRREALKSQLPILKEGLRYLGVPQVIAMNLEADDLAGILSRRYAGQGHKVLLISGDRDWHQLVRDGVGQYDPIREFMLTKTSFSDKVGYEKVTKDKATGAETKEWRGCPSPAAYVECKALMGDAGDNIPGVGGVGEKGAIELVREFGTVKGFFDAVEIHGAKVPKKLADFCSSTEKRGLFYRNLQLMDLAHPDIPAAQGMLIDKKTMDKDKFFDFCGEYAFNSLLTDFDNWLAPFSNQN